MNLGDYLPVTGKNNVGELVFIGAASIIALLLNAYGLIFGITVVLPHLLYIPIILASYYYPRRGIAYALVLSAIYLGMAAVFPPLTEILAAVGRICLLILVAFVVSFLTLRMQENEERYRGVAERISDVIFLIDRTGKAAYVSPSVQKILGYSPGEITGKAPEEFFHPDDLELIRGNFQKTIAGDTIKEMIIRFRKKDGNYTTMDFSGAPVFHNGSITGIQVVGRDVTEKIRAEQVVHASMKRYRDFIDFLPQTVFEFDTRGTITDVNRPGLVTLGLTMEDLNAGVNAFDFLVPEDRNRARDLAQRIYAGEKVGGLELTVLTRSGRKFAAIIYPDLIIRDSKPAGIRGIIIDITRRKEAENALRESEQKYRTLADYTYDWEYWIGPDNAILYTTPSCERITGYSQAEFYADKDLLGTIIFPEDRHALDHHLEQSFVQEKPAMVDFRIVQRNGEIRWIGHVCQPIFNEEGLFLGRRASNRDITHRKQVEDELLGTNQRFSDIVNFLPDPTFVIDGAGRVSAWNRAMEELTGIPAASILGRGDYAYATWFYGTPRPVLIDMVLHGDLEAIGARYPKYHREGNTIRAEADLHRPDGTVVQFWMTATPLYNQGGEVVGAIESLRDVTHQKAVIRALQGSKRYLDAIINSISDPVFVKDRQHHWVTLNEGFCQFIGHSREELLGKSDYDFFPEAEADIFWQKDEEVFSSREVNENEEDFTDSNGNRHRIVTKKSLYVNETGDVFIVGIIRDITERKRIETALQEAHRKLNMLSSITRHDILNQLMALSTYIELSKESESNPELIGYIQNEGEIAKRIERQIEFTRYYQDIGVQEPVWQDAGRLIETTAHQLNLGGITVENSVSGIEIFADPLIGKVFYNLMENSLRHGKTVTRITFSAGKTSNGLVLIYSDNGIGIPDEDKTNLFRKGFGKHTGLGLFLSREILSITGIAIAETGIPGTGARFEISVPDGAYRFSPST
jgi:PAS domain S-box-containing protein